MPLHGDPVNTSSDLDLSVKVSQIRYYSGHAPSGGVALRVDFSGDGDGAEKVSRVLRDQIENQWVATSFTSDVKTVRLQVWRQEQLVGECGVQFSRQCHKLGRKVVRLVGSKKDHSAEHGKYIGELVVEWRCLASWRCEAAAAGLQVASASLYALALLGLATVSSSLFSFIRSVGSSVLLQRSVGNSCALRKFVLFVRTFS